MGFDGLVISRQERDWLALSAGVRVCPSCFRLKKQRASSEPSHDGGRHRSAGLSALRQRQRVWRGRRRGELLVLFELDLGRGVEAGSRRGQGARVRVCGLRGGPVEVCGEQRRRAE